jgi:hypothetical protein
VEEKGSYRYVYKIYCGGKRQLNGMCIKHAVEEKGSYRYVYNTCLLWRTKAVIDMCIKYAVEEKVIDTCITHACCGGQRQL